MGQILHANARTTEAIRREIRNSEESIAKAAVRFNMQETFEKLKSIYKGQPSFKEKLKSIYKSQDKIEALIEGVIPEQSIFQVKYCI